MFKKTVLVGILLVALIVISGCGVYDPAFKGDSADKNYGGFKVPYASFPHDELPSNDCKDADMMQIGDLCFAVGTAARCSTLDNTQNSGRKWGSVNVPKYNANLCYPTCTVRLDCGSGGSIEPVCYTNTNFGGICAPVCLTDADCLPGLTHCENLAEYGHNYCVPDSDLSTAPTVVSTVVSPETLQVQPLLSNGWNLELEFNRVDRTHGWLNIYLTSVSKNQFSFGNHIELITNDNDLGKVEMHPFFVGSFGSIVGGNVIQLNGGPFSITPGAKTFLGRVYVDQTGAGNPVPLEVTLGSAGSSSDFTLAPFSACVPLTTACGSPKGKVCGALPDGCGNYIDCGQCADGNVCTVDGVCQSPLSQVLPAEAPSKDKTILQSVSDALKDANANKLQKLSALILALKTWFAAQ